MSAPARHFLVMACSQSKASQSAGHGPAMYVYDGPAWRTLRAWVKRHPVTAQTKLAVFALSAEYGLISAMGDVADSYDRKMDEARALELAACPEQRRRGRECFEGREVDLLFFGSGLYAGVLDELVPDDLMYRRAGEGNGRGIGDMLGELRAWLEGVSA